ncbi:hypothetical protein ACF061_24315 [Streptomyces sp. NPDC015220]|uniref:hypothetical protein n=1 Tax=Streptomyces sp. NPDC015220 TaxID=3364947 RepID=UPI0036FE11FF
MPRCKGVVVSDRAPGPARRNRRDREHRRLGLLPAQYAAFEAALCEALRIRAGAHWSVELEQAWVRMLRSGVAAMVRRPSSAHGRSACRA